MISVSPALSLTSFNCPHCKVLAQQFWWRAFSDQRPKDEVPTIWRPEGVEARIAEMEKGKGFNAEDMANAFAWFRKVATGQVIFGEKSDSHWSVEVDNISFSKCYHCDCVAVWVYDRLVHPAGYDAPPANVDMPPDVLADYSEAGQIAPLSPRGAAALLRLALQRLMPHLAEKGKDLNDDIASLVQKRVGQKNSALPGYRPSDWEQCCASRPDFF